MCWLFGHEARGILALWPGIEPAPPALEGKVLTTGHHGSPQYVAFSDHCYLFIFTQHKTLEPHPCSSHQLFHLLIVELYSTVWMYQSWLKHSLTKGHFGCFRFFSLILATTNKGATNNHYRFLWWHKFSFLWNKCPTEQLLGQVLKVFLKGFLRNGPAETFIFSPAVEERYRFFTDSLAFGIVSIFILAVLIGVYWWLIMVLICISLKLVMLNIFGELFLYALTHYSTWIFFLNF